MTKRAGFIALTGRPNVGKSTLLNHLVESTIAITSPKPQTTRTVIRGVATRNDTQFIFFDTPGMHRPKDLLGGAMMKGLNAAIADADVCVLLIEASFKPIIADTEKLLIKKIRENGAPAIVAINKIDKVAKANVLPLIDLYRQFACFKAFVPISAQTGDGVDLLLQAIEPFLPEQAWLFDDDDFTDQTEKDMASEIIRRELVLQMREELPYGLAVRILSFQERVGRDGGRDIKIEADIVCDRQNHKGMVVGKGGERIKAIGQEARKHLETLLDGKVTLFLNVRVEDKWRDSAIRLKDLGLE